MEIASLKANNNRTNSDGHVSDSVKNDNKHVSLKSNTSGSNPDCEKLKKTLINENKNNKLRMPKLLVLCDSHGRGLSSILKDLIGDRFHVEVFFKPNATVKQIVEDIQNLTKYFTTDDHVVIIGGTNDVNSNNIIRCVTKIANLCFKTNVIISTIPYRYDTPHWNVNQNIYMINKRIYKSISNFRRYNSNICVLDFNLHLNCNNYVVDGVHLNKSGKQILGENLSNVLIQRVNHPVKNNLIEIHCDESCNIWDNFDNSSSNDNVMVMNDGGFQQNCCKQSFQ